MIDFHGVEGYLRAMAMLRESMKPEPPIGWRWPCVEAMLLDVGRMFTFQPKPKDVRWGTVKECFCNALHLVERHDDLFYCEGIAGRVLPTWHAWCCTRDGVVIDPTWKPIKGLPDVSEYWGVALKREVVYKCMLSSKVYGVLFNWQLKWPLLTMHPEQFVHPLTVQEEKI